MNIAYNITSSVVEKENIEVKRSYSSFSQSGVISERQGTRSQKWTASDEGPPELWVVGVVVADVIHYVTVDTVVVVIIVVVYVVTVVVVVVTAVTNLTLLCFCCCCGYWCH